jgi:peptide-methionine (R)-S-oxide reductase
MRKRAGSATGSPDHVVPTVRASTHAWWPAGPVEAKRAEWDGAENPAPGNLLRRKGVSMNVMKTFGWTLFVALGACTAIASSGPDRNAEKYAVRKSDAEWRKQLSHQAYYVLRKAGTERPWTGKYNRNKAEGEYVCGGCGHPLFHSSHKFDSGTGWPSFTQPIENGFVEEVRDASYGMVRTEVRCSTCGGHLGHVFNDGPAPTGLRYCINSVALDFRPASAPAKNAQSATAGSRPASKPAPKSASPSGS